MDIEWALRGGQVFVVQARPITALPEPPPAAAALVAEQWPLPNPSAKYYRASVVELLPDPVSPLFATLVPIFWITRHPALHYDYKIPWWGSLPVWVAILLVGREILVTVFRQQAKRRGVIIPAGGAGKLKTVFQNCFIGGTIAWFAWKDLIVEMKLAGTYTDLWNEFHGAFIAITLGIAVFLTVYSLAVYLYQYRGLLHISTSERSN